jgi:hypothetical protein
MGRPIRARRSCKSRFRARGGAGLERSLGLHSAVRPVSPRRKAAASPVDTRAGRLMIAVKVSEGPNSQLRGAQFSGDWDGVGEGGDIDQESGKARGYSRVALTFLTTSQSVLFRRPPSPFRSFSIARRHFLPFGARILFSRGQCFSNFFPGPIRGPDGRFFYSGLRHSIDALLELRFRRLDIISRVSGGLLHRMLIATFPTVFSFIPFSMLHLHRCRD